MKIHKILPGCTLLALLAFGCNSSQSNKVANESLADIYNEFENPSKKFRTAPLWVWNNKQSKADIDRMLESFKDQGFGGAFVHPRPGLITDYLSDEWFDLFDYSVQKGKELDLNIWIYDENSYPSGFAGGHVAERMPESYNLGSALMPLKYEILPDDLSDVYFVLMVNDNKIEDITANVADFKSKPGLYYTYHKTYKGASDWTGGFPYTNIIEKGVTDLFIDVTFNGYAKRNKKDFGENVPGIFTDEPEINSPGGIYYCSDLFEQFQQTFNYDLKPNFVSLHSEIGDYKKIRHDYYTLMNKLFIERFAKPVHDYCEANNLKLTGHVWEHNWPNVNGVPDNMSFASYQQLPGVDMLFNQFNEESPYAQFGNIRAIKEVRSIANQMGRKQILCETYGGAGWETTFKDFKRLGDWQAALGINFMNQHLSHSSFAGARKYDYPPMFATAASWWDNYRVLNDYFARISMMLTFGEQYNDILLIEPTSTIFCYSSYMGNSEKVHQIGDQFQKLVTSMERHQLEYDIACEDLIKRMGSTSNGKYRIGQREYSTLVITPETENLESETFRLLQQYLADGGRLVAYSKPTLLDGKASDEVCAFFDNPAIVSVSDYTPEALDKVFANDGVRYDYAKQGKLYHQRRHYKDGELFFLTNVDLDAETEVTVFVNANSAIEMNAFNGGIYSYPYDKETKSFKVKLAPAESKTLFVSQKNLKASALQNKVADQILAAVSPLSVQRTKDNVMTLDFVDLTMDGKTLKGLHTQKASNEAFYKADFKNGNPWQHKVQFRQKIVDRDTFSTHGFTVTYRFDAETKDADFKNVRVGVERARLYKIKVNGKEVKPTDDYFFDTETFLAPIGDLIKEGENLIEVTAPQFSVFAEIEPIYLVGDFNVKIGDKNFIMTKPASPESLCNNKEAGAPFYPYAMSYSKKYQINKAAKQFIVKADQFVGIVAEVWVNGKKAGVIFSNPYTLDITEDIRDGINEVDVRVIGSMNNVIGPFYNAVNGLTGPGSFGRNDKIKGPADYRFTPYGLVSDFTVSSSM